MKHVKIFTATVAAMALTASISLAGPNCGAKASAQQVSEKSCSSTATATTVSAGTCATKATTASSGSCASKATAASSGSCASKATYTASNGASCASKASMASANCSPEECSARKIVYTASFGEKDKWTTDRAQATTWAEKGATVQYMAAGKTFADEHDAAQTLATALYTEMQELMTVAYAVEGEVMHCAKTAEAKAVSAGCASKMKFTVAGREFASQQDAEKHLEKVQMRLASVAKLMDDKGNAVEGCAEGHAKKAGDCTFVFGDQKIEDPTIANVAVLQERVQAILDTEA